MKRGGGHECRLPPTRCFFISASTLVDVDVDLALVDSDENEYVSSGAGGVGADGSTVDDGGLDEGGLATSGSQSLC